MTFRIGFIVSFFLYIQGTLKTMLVDDSQNVANLMVVICTKIGITNYDEYSLVSFYLFEVRRFIYFYLISILNLSG